MMISLTTVKKDVMVKWIRHLSVCDEVDSKIIEKFA